MRRGTRKYSMCYVILILGGLLIMMGQHARSEALFYYFKLEEYIPENHLLRLIDKHISLAFVRERLKDSYSETGRPSIDPELLLRILPIGYLYGITSERKLVLLGSILCGTGGSGMLAYPKAAVILVFLDKREIFRAALPKRL